MTLSPLLSKRFALGRTGIGRLALVALLCTLSPLTQARTASTQWHRVLQRSRESSGSSLQPKALLRLSSGALLVVVASEELGREGILLGCDAQGHPMATNYVDGFIQEALVAQDDNLLLLQTLQDTEGNRSSRSVVSKFTPQGQLLWRSPLPSSTSLTHLYAPDRSGNLWLTQTPINRANGKPSLSRINAQGRLEWTRSFNSYPNATQLGTFFKDLVLDPAGNAFLVQTELFSVSQFLGADIVISKIKPNGFTEWTTREDLRQFSRLPSPFLNRAPETGRFQLALDSQGNVILAGDTWHMSQTGLREYLTTPKTFVISYSPLGARLWIDQTVGEIWEGNPVIAVDSHDRVIIAKSSIGTLITTAYAALGQGRSEWTQSHPVPPTDRSEVTPLQMRLDASDNPLIYLMATYDGLGNHSGPYNTQSELLNLTSAGNEAWSLVITNLTANQVGLEGYTLPLLTLEADGKTRLLGNAHAAGTSGLAADLGAVLATGEPANPSSIEVHIADNVVHPFELGLDADESVYLASSYAAASPSVPVLRLAKFRKDGERLWDTDWILSDASVLNPDYSLRLSRSGYAALSHVTTETNRVVRLIDPQGVTRWTRLIESGSVLAVADNGSIWVTQTGQLPTRIASISVDGTTQWATEFPIADSSLMRIYPDAADTGVLAIESNGSLEVTLYFLSATGIQGWRQSLNLGGTRSVRDASGAIHITGGSLSDISGQGATALTMTLSASGQIVSSNRIDIGSTSHLQSASDQGVLFRLKAGTTFDAEGIFYEPDKTTAQRMVQEGLWVAYDTERTDTVQSLLNTALHVNGTFTIGPAFTSLNQAYCVAHWGSGKLQGWDLFSFRFQDGVEKAAQGVRVYGSGTPNSAYQLESSRSLSGPWLKGPSYGSDGQGDLLHTEPFEPSGNRFFRFVPAAENK